MWPFTKSNRNGIHDSEKKEATMEEENKMEADQTAENKEQPAAPAPAGDAPAAAAPEGEAVPEGEAQETSDGAATAGEKPAEAPAEEKPAEEKPAEAPAEEKPAEEKPAEEKPAEPDWKDRYARALADFDNFRRRTERDREDLAKFAAREVIKDLLTTADNLALALDKAKDKADDPFVAGVKMVYDGLLKTLADHGATPLDAVGEPFDANFHEALAQLPSADVEEGVVMNEVKRGWLMHGRLLRAAQVVVSAGKGA